MAEIIEEVLKAEKEAEIIKENAEKQSSDIISKAKLQAKELMDTKIKEFENNKANELKIIKKENSELRKKMLSENDDKIKVLKNSSSKNIEKAAKLVLDKFMESIE